MFSAQWMVYHINRSSRSYRRTYRVDVGSQECLQTNRRTDVSRRSTYHMSMSP